MKPKQIVGLIIAAVILIGMYFIPTPERLSVAGFRTLGLTVAFLAFLMTEAMPIPVTCLLFTALMPVLGVTIKFTGAISGFSASIMFFILASFGLSTAFVKVPLSKRFLAGLLKYFGKNVKTILFAFMLCGGIVSGLFSNLPEVAIFMAIGLSFLELYDDPAEKKRTGRALMIAIPIASMVGGLTTPAGSSLNLLAINLLKDINGEVITFADWMLYGIPATAVLIPFAWYVIIKVYKPADIDTAKIGQFIKNLNVPEKIEHKEKYFIIIVLVMLALWIVSSWVPQIDVVVVSLIACVIMFLPGIEILDWKSFTDGVGWEAYFITGTVLSIGNAIVANGLSVWLVQTFYPTGLTLPLFGMIAVAALFTFVMLLLIPIAPALITVLAAPLVGIAVKMNFPPSLLIVTLAFCASNCYLFPIDSVPLMTYASGYYKMTDMPKSTIYLQIFMVIVLAVWLPIAAKLLGVL